MELNRYTVAASSQTLKCSSDETMLLYIRCLSKIRFIGWMDQTFNLNDGTVYKMYGILHWPYVNICID